MPVRAGGGHRGGVGPHIRDLLANVDPPERTRLRRTVTASFMVKRAERRRPCIQQIIVPLIDDMPAGPRPADPVRAIGLPVPSRVITASSACLTRITRRCR
jgi:cytochrome P450